MLDVHPPHSPTHTWRDFFIHIATITVGLLIAVSLEQTVEWLHRRHQVAETRKALETERRININRFAVTTEQFERIIPILQRNMAVFVALRQHPGSPGPLPLLDWNVIRFLAQDEAWQTAKQTNVLESMPAAEARADDNLYRRLHILNDDLDDETKTITDATLFTVADPDPTHLSPQQLDRQIELTARVLQAFRNMAVDQGNLHHEFPDFSPSPKREETEAIRHQPHSPEWITYSSLLVERVYNFDKAQTSEAASDR